MTELHTTGYKLNRLLANRNGEWKGMGYGYLYGAEVGTRELIWFQGLRTSLHEGKVIVYYRTRDGHEHLTGFTAATTGFARATDQEAAEAEWESSK